MRRKTLWLVALFLLALAVSLPLGLNLDVLRQQMHVALERQLGREVQFASLGARLVPRPGIVGQRVIIHELDEEFGAEPFLYAEEMQCDLSLRVFWTGHLEFSHINFVRPSINLVRNSRQAWNVGSFLLRNAGALGDGLATGQVKTVVSVTEGRINFKLGADKQVYALSDARLRLEPLPEGRWGLQLQATPIRVDRRLTETGDLRVQGELGRAQEFSALPFRLEMSLERSSLAQLMSLYTGREPLLRAQASLDALLNGTPAQWRARGKLTVVNLRRWDLVAAPLSPRWETEFNLTMLASKPVLVIEKATLRSAQSEVRLAGSVHDPLGQAAYDLEVNAGALALADLMRQLAGLKADVSTEAQLDGVVQMTLSARGPMADWRGELYMSEPVRLRAPGLSRPLELPDVQLRLQDGRLELSPLTLKFAPEHEFVVSGELDLLHAGFPYRLHWRGQDVALEPLRWAAAVFGWDLFGAVRWQGQAALDLEWRGSLAEGAEQRWHGQADLRNAKFYPPEFNRALEIEEAHLEWQGPKLAVQPVRFRLGEDTVTGTLRRQGRAGPWSVRLAAERLQLAALDRLLNPARRGLLARLVGHELRRPHGWEQLAAVGEVRVGELLAGPFRFVRFQAEGAWELGWLDLSRLRFRAYGGRFEGRMQGDFRESPPQYRLAGNLRQADLASLLTSVTGLGELFSGSVGADLSFRTAGTRPRELLGKLRGHVVGGVQDGAMANLDLLAAMSAASNLERSPRRPRKLTEWQSLTGTFRVAEGQVEVDGAQLIVDAAALELSGGVGFDGRVDLHVSGEPLRVAGRRPSSVTARLLSSNYRLRGTLRQPEVTLAEPGPAAAAER